MPEISIDALVQIFLGTLSMTAVYCVTSRQPSIQRWGPVFGLCSQPFWLYASWSADQMGIFFASVIYTGMWIRGIYNQWIVHEN